MVALTYGWMQTRVAKNCNNIPTSHPQYELINDASGRTVINEAANRLILHAVAMDRRAANCFVELRNNRWSDTLTTHNDNSVNLPDDLLIVEAATYTKSTASYNPATQTEYPMTRCSDPERFAYLSKTATGWPQQWRRAGSAFEYWPKTTTTPTDYSTVLVLYGLAREQTLTSTSATYTMNEIWHPTIIKCATALMFEALGEQDEADGWWAKVDKDVTATLNLYGLEQMSENVTIEIAGVPK